MIKETYLYLKKVIIIFVGLLVLISIYMYINDKNTIKIGTKNMTEQQIIAYALKDIIEDETNLKVDIVSGMDTSSILNSALKHGDIDLYMEYSSVAFIEIYKHKYENQSKEEVKEIIKKDYEKDDLIWETNLGFENSNVIICSNICKEENINKLSQIPKDYNFKFGAAPYFYKRSDGFNLLLNTYGFSNYKKLNIDSTLVYSAIKNQDVDLGLSFSTDAKLLTGDYNYLEDDLNAFPKYEAGLVSSKETLKKYPELEGILKEFENSIKTEDIQKYNGMVENENYSVEDIGKLIADKVRENKS